ncbi:hypothetical protein [Marinobacter xestospongiae]|uniref:DUF1570 domain-containing protein n=1 Tax=Marinobacter xestospongiae TaxID=994319 RepID=A0ABU3W401_9GAMM|nr:hypothetical protein [Marinobacter xestospongiae]MDV2081136.1 hypothetical protein [Marinobacter xestospongiae]
MTLKRAANLVLAMAMLLCAWFLLSGTSPRALWFNLSGSTAAREAALDDRYGLQVHYEKGTPALPALWQLPPVSGTAVPADAKCVAAFMPRIQAELEKYRPAALKAHFRNLYLFKALTLFDVDYGATVQGRDILMTLDCRAGYTGREVAKTLHHELSSLLLEESSFPSVAWKATNMAGFRYLENDQAVLAAISEPHNMRGEASLYRQGFLAAYGKTTLENDINLYAEVAMVEPDRLAELAEQYPRIAAKFRLLAGYYQAFVSRNYLQLVSLKDRQEASASE